MQQFTSEGVTTGC